MKTSRLALFTCLMLLMCVGPALAQLGGGGAPQHDKRVSKILDANDITYNIDDDGDFSVTFDLGNGRSQLAIIMSSTSEYRNFEVREIWSVGYQSPTDDIPSAVANMLLEDTFVKKLGAWGKEDDLAIFITRLAADADGESLMSALTMALEAADEMETKLTGDRDQF